MTTEMPFSALGHMVMVTVDQSSPRTAHLKLRLDGTVVWESDEPGWRPIGYGVSDGVFFCWSARRVHALDLHSATVTTVILVDEEVVVPFPRTPEEWIVVCETSVRRFVNGEEVAIQGLSDVAVGASLSERTLVVRGLENMKWIFDMDTSVRK